MKTAFRVFSSLSLLLLCAQAEPGEKPVDVPDEIQKITVTARPLEGFYPVKVLNEDVLEWVGGVDLSSAAKGFGGFSALSVGANGRDILAISDGGVWMTFHLQTDGEIPSSISNAQLAPLKNPAGKSVSGEQRGDAESFGLQNGQAVIGFEGADVIWSYPFAADGSLGVPHAIPVPDDVKKLRFTRGLESIAVFPPSSRYAGALLAIGESPVRGEENLRAWIIGGTNFRRLTILPHDGFQVTDAAFLDDGTLLMLERRFLPPFGITARIRRVNGADIAGGARLDGELIFEARLGAPIDNMEGMSVHKGADGASYVTLISDDNYNVFQRTLLLRFRYKK
ncbi:MAG: esterase-like activity of phytase family protein [Pseudomonadota bacterium]